MCVCVLCVGGLSERENRREREGQAGLDSEEQLRDDDHLCSLLSVFQKRQSAQVHVCVCVLMCVVCV